MNWASTLPKSLCRPPHRRRRAACRLAAPSALAILRHRQRNRRLIGTLWLARWGLRFHPNPNRPQRARIRWQNCLAFPRHPREPESKAKKNAANEAKSALPIRTKRTNGLRGNPPAIVANLSRDMSGHRATRPAGLILARLAIDLSLAVQEATKKGIASRDAAG